MGYWLSHEIKEGYPLYSGYACVMTKGLIIDKHMHQPPITWEGFFNLFRKLRRSALVNDQTLQVYAIIKASKRLGDIHD